MVLWKTSCNFRNGTFPTSARTRNHIIHDVYLQRKTQYSSFHLVHCGSNNWKSGDKRESGRLRKARDDWGVSGWMKIALIKFTDLYAMYNIVCIENWVFAGGRYTHVQWLGKQRVWSLPKRRSTTHNNPKTNKIGSEKKERNAEIKGEKELFIIPYYVSVHFCRKVRYLLNAFVVIPHAFHSSPCHAVYYMLYENKVERTRRIKA